MGRVAAPHGVRGGIKVQPLCADPATLLGFPRWWLRAPTGDGAWIPHRVGAGRLQSGMLVAELESIASREAAAALRGAEVGIPRDALPAPAAGEYYRSDLIGMTVVNRGGETLGRAIDFAESGAHPILRVVGADGGERLIPWVPHYVDGVDVPARRIDVDWPADF
jgi:16S rRNA processing protein RimM